MCISSQHHLQHELQKSASSHSFGGLPHSHSFSGRIVFDQTTSSIVTSNEMVRVYLIFFFSWFLAKLSYLSDWVYICTIYSLINYPGLSKCNKLQCMHIFRLKIIWERLFKHSLPPKNVILVSVHISALYSWKSIFFSK